MEARYLKDAIEEHTREAAGAFLEARALRRQGLSPETCALEERLEQGEGMALYIEHRAEVLLQHEAAPVGALLDEVIRSGHGSGARGFAITGMAQAVLLDRWAPAWKDRLMREERLTVTDLLAEIAPKGAGLDRRILLNNAP
jgi:hypothetical protein